MAESAELLNPLLSESGDLRDSLPRGLSSVEAAAKLARFGRNEVPVETPSRLSVFLRQFSGTMPAMLVLACVLSAAVKDWEDFGIIAAMLLLNATIGFYEESKAMAALDALQAKLRCEVSALRDGRPVSVDVAELVPGDVVALRGGQAVPADALWIGGDVIKLDTAALTGEPIPWNVPRVAHGTSGADSPPPELAGESKAASPPSPKPFKGDAYGVAGRRMLSGCVVAQGECSCVITETGLDTEIGKAMGLVAEAQAGPKAMGLFESKILAIIKLLICATLGFTAVVFAVQLAVRGEPFDRVLLVSLSLVIGAVPIALPLVMQVTMALGARSMAEHAAIITHTTALQEIASMTVLNSDKTGTLTTAKMSVIPSMVWVDDGARHPATGEPLTRDDCLTMAALACNAANLEDPVDCAILAAFKARFAAQGEADPKHAEHARGSLRRASTWGRRSSFAGFNPDVKRAVATFEGCEAALGLATAKIAKGLLDKVLDTGGDGGEHQWVVEGLARRVERPRSSEEEATTTRAVGARLGEWGWTDGGCDARGDLRWRRLAAGWRPTRASAGAGRWDLGARVLELAWWSVLRLLRPRPRPRRRRR